MNEKNKNENLPEGWRWVKLGEVCVEETGFRNPANEPDLTFCYVDISSIDAVEKKIIAARNIIGKEAPSRARQVIKQNDILVATTRPNLNAVAKVPAELDDQICSTGFCVLRSNGMVLPDYLFAYVRHKPFIDGLSDLVKGALYPAVTDKQVKNQMMPLPSLAEQERIAGVLREGMAAIDKARAAAQARLEAAQALPGAYLREIFPAAGEKLPDGWRWVKLGEVCEVNPPRPTIIRKDDEDTSFIPMEAIDAITGRVYEIKVRPYGEVKKGYTFFKNGDVLFAKITPCMQNRKHAIAQELIDGIGFGTTEFHVLRPGKDIISEWIYFFVRQSEFLVEATHHFTGAVGQQRLPQDYLARTEIPLPSYLEQQQIVSMLHEKMVLVEKARAAAQAELETIHALPGALLRRAFNGEL